MPVALPGASFVGAVVGAGDGDSPTFRRLTPSVLRIPSGNDELRGRRGFRCRRAAVTAGAGGGPPSLVPVRSRSPRVVALRHCLLPEWTFDSPTRTPRLSLRVVHNADREPTPARTSREISDGGRSIVELTSYERGCIEEILPPGRGPRQCRTDCKRSAIFRASPHAENLKDFLQKPVSISVTAVARVAGAHLDRVRFSFGATTIPIRPASFRRRARRSPRSRSARHNPSDRR